MDKKMLKAVVRHPNILFPKRHILLLSHMRAYTSLLGHMIGSHPSVSGYYEQHIGYYSRRSMVRARLLYHVDHAKEGCTPIYFDKLLHNGQGMRKDVLKDKRICLIFMLREPSYSIHSIMKLHGRWNSKHRYGNSEGATNYYIERLAMLRHFAEIVGTEKKAFYIDAEELIENTDATLECLTNFLNLDPPLSQEYKIFEHTGEPGRGDTSKSLKEGVVSRGKPTESGSHSDIPKKYLNSAQEKYTEVRNVMLNICENVSTK